MKVLVALLASLLSLSLATGLTLWTLVTLPFIQPPEIGRGLSSDVRQSTAEFTRRVRVKYGDLSDADLRTALGGDGFRVENTTTKASFTTVKYFCELEWTITWERQDQKVSDLGAGHYWNCI